MKTKKKFFPLLILLIPLLVLFAAQTSRAAPENGNALDDLMKRIVEMNTFDGSAYGLEGNYELVEEIQAKLEEAGEPCRVRLAARRHEDGVYDRALVLEVIPASGDSFAVPLSDDVRGFQSSIAAKNFTSRKKSEILLTVTGGKWGERFLIVSVAEGKGKVILDTQADNIPAVAGKFFDDYRAEIIVLETGERALIDLSPRKPIYDRRLVYNESGTLRSGVNIWVDKLSLFDTPDVDNDGIHEIKEVMDLNGVTRADRVAYVEATLKYGGGKWNVIDSWIAPEADLLRIPIPIRIR